MMNALKTWFENAWWSWGNCISFRFDKYAVFALGVIVILIAK